MATQKTCYCKYCNKAFIVYASFIPFKWDYPEYYPYCCNKCKKEANS